MAYAERTTVPVEKTQGEIRKMVANSGASAFAVFEETGRAMVAFKLGDRNIRMSISLIHRSQFSSKAEKARYEQAHRRKWRALGLVIKAKLESVASKIETLEEAFLPHIVMANGRTVYEEISEPIALNYKGGNVPLLPPPGGS